MSSIVFNSCSANSVRSWDIIVYSAPLEKIEKHSFELQKSEVKLFPFGEIFKWSKFIYDLQQKSAQIPKPYHLINLLVKKYLAWFHSLKPILDIGCETGKNALCLLQAGHKVTLLDIAPNALEATVNNLKRKNLSEGIVDTIVGKIEDLSEGQGPFKAVIGTYVFSFIPPEIFERVMKKILKRIEPNGYFAGGFFGQEHAWATDRNLTCLSRESLEKFFCSRNFVIVEMTEQKENTSTVCRGRQLFHVIEIIAKRII